MVSNELLSELHKLSRADKLRVMQVLIEEMALEELGMVSGTHYEVWSPYDAAGAAVKLMKMLEDDKKSSDA